MSEEEKNRVADDATISEAVYAVAERELNGEVSLEKFILAVNDIIHAQTIGAQG